MLSLKSTKGLNVKMQNCYCVIEALPQLYSFVLLNPLIFMPYA